MARLLSLALRNIADDAGRFEWKPVQIKMKLFPNDAVEIDALLAELIERKQIVRYEVGGVAYAYVRNFEKYQRPKTPKVLHPAPIPPNGEIEGAKVIPFPPKEEMPPQMKEEGCRRKEEEEENQERAARDGSRYAFEGKVIRLTHEDFEAWRLAYQNLDLRAELTAVDAWYGENLKPEDRGKWFVRCATHLKNQNTKLRGLAPQSASPKRANPERVEFKALFSVDLNGRPLVLDTDSSDVREAARKAAAEWDRSHPDHVAGGG
jgi:hypothetical protein